MTILKLLSFNLRIDVPADGEQAWKYRKEGIKSFLLDKDIDLIGFQEAGPHMYEYLKNNLVSYDSFGVKRSLHGEATPIFIKKNTYTLLDSKTIWLTATPHIESTIDDSYYPRIATYIVFKDKTNQVIAFFNTHLDNSGDKITYKQSVHLQNYIESIKEKFNARIIIGGDFNSYPETKTITYFKQKYQTTFKQNNINQLTFHGYREERKGEPIDYFFIDKQIVINSFKIIHHKKENFLSDHYPIKISVTY